MDWLHPRIRLGWIGLGRILRDILWIGLDWIGLRSRYFNVILIVIALSDCQCVHIFRLSFDVNCCVTNWLLLLLLVVIHVDAYTHQFKMLNSFLYTNEIVFAAGGSMDCIGLDVGRNSATHHGSDWIGSVSL